MRERLIIRIWGLNNEFHFMYNGLFRLNIRMNDDHLLIILDRKQTILDVYFPVKVDYKRVEAKFLTDERILRILVPVVW